jgi:hypothetical protein
MHSNHSKFHIKRTKVSTELSATNALWTPSFNPSNFEKRLLKVINMAKMKEWWKSSKIAVKRSQGK